MTALRERVYGIYRPYGRRKNQINRPKNHPQTPPSYPQIPRQHRPKAPNLSTNTGKLCPTASLYTPPVLRGAPPVAVAAGVVEATIGVAVAARQSRNICGIFHKPQEGSSKWKIPAAVYMLARCYTGGSVPLD